MDITRDQEAMKEMQRVTFGARSVPVITVGAEVMVGFDPARLEKALNPDG